MDIKTHKQLERILTKAAKDADEKVLEARSGTEKPDFGDNFKWAINICTLNLERYETHVQHHTAHNNHKAYVHFLVIYTRHFDSTMSEESEIYFLRKMLKKSGIKVNLSNTKQIEFYTQPTEENVHHTFSTYIYSERKIYQEKSEYLQKLNSLVDQIKKKKKKKS